MLRIYRYIVFLFFAYERACDTVFCEISVLILKLELLHNVSEITRKYIISPDTTSGVVEIVAVKTINNDCPSKK